MIRQILRFGAIGALATIVHLLIGMVLIQSGQAPLFANGIAFAVAFIISFLGHLSFSFVEHQSDPRAALWRFGCVALTGFCVNQVILWCLLQLSDLPPTLALGIAVSAAATLSFALSRQWAFRRAGVC